MAYRSTADGSHGAFASVIHADAAHAGWIDVPDAELLFTADFHRAGPDLILVGHDGSRHIVPGYFASEKLPALLAPNGARLTPDLIELLAGSPTPGQYAQARPIAAADPIGKVEKVVGDATAIRNGVAVTLHVGDPVYKSDIIQTGANSSVGIGFPDGTALNLVANTRMALNEYSFDPNGTSNSALFSAIHGSFAFVAGKVAHTGDMKIATPVATMGIRGTAGYGVEQIGTITATAGNVTWSFAVVADPGTDHVSQFQLIDQFGNVVGLVDQAGFWTTVSWQGTTEPPTVTTQPMTDLQFGVEQQLVPPLLQILNDYISNPTPNPVPQSTPNSPGSSTPPNELNNLPQLLQNNSGTQYSVTITTPSSPSPTTETVVVVVTTPPEATPTSAVNWISATGGSWEVASNWSDGFVPQSWETVGITTPVTVTVDGAEAVAGLTISSGAVLDIVDGGSLLVTNGISNSGLIEINSSGADPTLEIDGTVYLLDGGTVEMLGPTAQNLILGVAGTGASLVNVNNEIIGSGTIGQGDGALTLVNGSAGIIVASGGTLVLDTGNVISNSGVLEAAAGGTLQIEDSVDNIGTIEVAGDGTLSLVGDTVTAGTLVVGGGGAAQGGTVDISGTVTLTGGGTVSLENGGDMVVAAPGGGTLVNVDDTITGGGTIGGNGLALVNDGIIDANNPNAALTLDPSSVTNAGTLEATDGGTLVVDDSVNNSGTLAADGGTVDVTGDISGSGSVTIGAGGTFELGGTDAQAVTFAGAGTLKLDGGSNFTGSVNGLATGDTIDLANTIATSVVFDGSTLTVNGEATSFTISGLPAGDTFFFTSDGAAGTDLTVEAAPTVTIDTIEVNNVLNANEAAAGFTIAGTASDTGVAVTGQTVTVDILNSSDGVVETYTGTVQANGTWSVNVSSTDAQGLADGSYTVTANLSDAAVNPATEASQTLTVAETVPVIAVPGAQTIGVGQAAAIGGVSLAESGSSSGETFTVTLTDSSGDLSVSGSGGTVTGSGSDDLVITGTLSQVNSYLATLTDTDGTAGSDPITVTATDSFGNAATQETIAVTVAGLPAIAVPGAQTIGVGQAAAIGGVSLAEAGSSSGETFTVTLTDSSGDLSVSGSGGTVTGSGSDDLVITGTLSQVNSYLATLTDTDGTAGSDPITVTATDSFGNAVTQETIAVTVAGLPAIAVPGAQTIGVGQAAAIGGVSLAEAGSSSGGETFTVTLTDSSGDLSVSGSGGTVTGSGSDDLVITGTLSQVNSYLATLTDTDGTAGSDPITVTATDSFGNAATQETIAVTVAGLPAIAVPGAQTIGIGQAAAIGGVSLAETGSSSGETFTVTLTDSSGDLSVSGSGGTVTGSGSDDLVITGTLSQVNSYLATLTDTDGTAGSDPITVTATDSFGNAATQETIAVTVAGLPAIAVPGAQALEIDEATLISGITLSEAGNSASETFTVTLTDSTGVLSATTSGEGGGGTITSADDGTSLTITGTRSQVNADLSTLTDTDTAADTITVNATDSLGNSATPETIDVTESAPLTIAVPTAVQTLALDGTTPITGVSLAESGSTVDERFTVTLTDAYGVLSATTSAAGGGGTIVSTDDGTELTISGTLGEVDADLTTLTDTNDTIGSDPITVNATDSLGNVAATQTITVSVSPNLAVNGAFQTGNFNGWTESGNEGYTGVESGIGLNGGEAAYIGPIGSNVDLSQNIATIPGDTYQVQFWLENLGGTPNDFSVSFGGTTLLSLTNSSAQGYTEYTYDVTATSSSTELLFAGRQDPTYWYLDDVSVVQITSVSWINANGGHWTDASNAAANWSDGAIPNSAEDVIVAASSSAAYTVTIAHGDTADANSLTVDNAEATVLDDGALTLITGLSVTAGTFDLAGGSLQTTSIDVGNGGSFIGDGTVQGSVAITGAIEAAGSILDFTGAVTGTGSFTIDSGATLEFGSSVAAGATVTFGGSTGELILGDADGLNLTINSFAGTEAKLADSDGIDLAGTWTTDSPLAGSGGNLVVVLTDGNGHTVTLTFDDFSGTLNVGTDGNGGTLITDPPATPSTTKSSPGWVATTADLVEAPAPLSIALQGAPTFGFDEAALMFGIGLAEAGGANGAIFTTTLTDSTGDLSANTNGDGGGGTITGSGTTSLTITGTLSQVIADLATLTDTNNTPGSETITLTATDNLGDHFAPQTIAVTVDGGANTDSIAGLAGRSWTSEALGGDAKSVYAEGDHPNFFSLIAATLSTLENSIIDGSHLSIHSASPTGEIAGFEANDAWLNTHATSGRHRPDAWTSADGVTPWTGTDDAYSVTTTWDGRGSNSPVAAHGGHADVIAAIGLLEAASATAGDLTSFSVAGSTCRGGGAESVIASFTVKSVGDGTGSSLDLPADSGGHGLFGFKFPLGNDQFDLPTRTTVTHAYGVGVPEEQGTIPNQAFSASIGGPGHDHFVFDHGGDDIVHVNPQAGVIEPDHLINAQAAVELASFITSNAHCDAVIDVTHGDTITMPGMTVNHLQAQLHSLMQIHG